MAASNSPDQPLHRALGLTDAEYEDIIAVLGRQPNALELALYGDYTVLMSDGSKLRMSRNYRAKLKALVRQNSPV